MGDTNGHTGNATGHRNDPRFRTGGSCEHCGRSDRSRPPRPALVQSLFAWVLLAQFAFGLPSIYFYIAAGYIKDAQLAFEWFARLVTIPAVVVLGGITLDSIRAVIEAARSTRAK